MQSEFTVKSFNELARANTIYFKETVHIPNERAMQAVWLHIQLYNLGIFSSVSKRKSDIVRINANVLAY